ncbi:Zinc finger homeobox protein 3, partial [Dissostichus eleginoides]
ILRSQQGQQGEASESPHRQVRNLTRELSEDVEAASETTTDQEDQTKDRESGGEKELTKGTAVSGHSERHQSDSPIPSKRPSSRSETSESPLSSKRPRTAEKSAAEQMYQCPYCKFTNTDLNRLRMHVMTQHSVQPMLRCPLCQDMLNNKVHLQFHLTHLHSVAPDCVEKLVASVSASEVLPASMFIPVPSPDRESQSTPHATANSNSEDIKKPADASDADPEKGMSLPTETAESQKSPPEDQQSERDDATGFLCWKKGCNQVFKSSNSLQMHFNEVHNKRPQLPVSDRHVYKYRCNQCSLAFKTVEKLQLHSQYHVIRAATMCCLCQRSFRTLQALKKHLETSHLELTEADIQQLYGGLLMNGDIMVMGDPSLGEEHGSLGEDEKEGDESDQEDKQSPTGSDSGSLQEDSGSEPKRALPFRKGPNFTMEKFLDPSRPFKCTVCKESFTQKNILLVHYNSVSHLHKVKRALQESTTGQPEPTSSPDNKPFKCSTCNVAYSQSSTLEIHMRSVLHQTKARAAKLEAAGGIPSSASATGLSGEFQLNPEISLSNAALGLAGSSTSSLLEDLKNSAQQAQQKFYGSKRSSRTRFTDYQLRVLQDFFDANAYPKDDEFEQLSNLLGLPTRVIVVWFQNARQKARKNYENQGEGAKEGERRELSNDRYVRTTNLNYQCKKCSLVFQRIFDLIKHQKKLCYKDEDDEGQYDSHNEDSMDYSNDCYTPSGSSCHTPMPSSSSLCPLPPSTSAFSQLPSTEKEEALPASTSNLFDEKPKELPDISADLARETQTSIKQEVVHQPQSEAQHHRPQREEKIQTKPIKHSSSSFSQQQQQCGPSASQTSQASSQSQHMSLNAHMTSATQQLAQQMIPYQCDQCKIGFPSFEHWQEHQQLHFLSVQNQFIHPQFLDRPIDMSFMLFDPSNPLLASQLLSGAMPQIPSSSATSPSTPTSTMNSLKRKLEEKAGTSPGENDSTNSAEERQRDKRLRTTITPEQLEILYQKALLSPSSIKVEGMEDFETATMSSVNLSYDPNKLDNDDCSSVNTAITDTTTGDEANADNDSADAKHSQHSGDYLSKSGGTAAILETDDQMSSGLVSPATSYYTREYDEHIIEHSETSSLADPCSPSPGASGTRSIDSGDRPGQKRFRTQMNNLQLKLLKSCFNDYRTPTMLECEVLGNDIGLPKRVVQVWFQNARAKEKKAKLNMAKHFGINQTSYEGPRTECTLCGVKYTARLSIRDHIFSQQHINKVKDTIGSQIDKEKEYFDPATVRQLMAQQEMDRIKKANEVLGLAQQQAMQQHALTPPKPSNLLNMPGASVPSPSLPTSGLPNKLPSSSSLAASKRDAEGIREKEKSKEKTEKSSTPSSTGSTPVPSTSAASAKKEKPDTAVPAISMPTPGMEYVVDPAQLQALQAALASDPTALLTNQFLPYFMPGFSPYYSPQIPGALQGGYLQPMYGMESLFPYNPALSQAMMGLSPGSLLQHYQQYQQSLQDALQQQQRQLQQIQQPKASQTPVPHQPLGDRKESAKDQVKTEEQKGKPNSEPPNSSSSHKKVPSQQKEMDGKALNKYIVPK